jgi:hypothetical protein
MLKGIKSEIALFRKLTLKQVQQTYFIAHNPGRKRPLLWTTTVKAYFGFFTSDKINCRNKWRCKFFIKISNLLIEPFYTKIFNFGSRHLHSNVY